MEAQIGVDMALVSFVIPCYRSAETIEGVVEEIVTTVEGLQRYAYEIVLVNDYSPDNTFEVIKKLCEQNQNIVGINLARNSGQHAAVMAGLRHAKGDIAVCLDDDGQTPADEAGKLIAAIEEGYDVVFAKYENKQHAFYRNIGTKLNELMTRYMLGKPKELYTSSYCAMRRFVIDEIVRYENAYPYLVGLLLRSTQNITNVNVKHRRREVGSSGYTFAKLLGLWFNGFTAFSVKPLRIATVIGGACAVLGFAYGIYTIIKKFINPLVPLGFSSLMAAVVFIGGMMMLMLGLIGEYIGRMYISMNNAPQYVVREILNEKKE